VESGHYHVDLINADVPLNEVLAVMRAGTGKKGARLLMSGESGAGKTEYAKYLARELGAPLRQRRASDLLHWRLGMYERLIHREFVEAARDARGCCSLTRSRALSRRAGDEPFLVGRGVAHECIPHGARPLPGTVHRLYEQSRYARSRAYAEDDAEGDLPSAAGAQPSSGL